MNLWFWKYWHIAKDWLLLSYLRWFLYAAFFPLIKYLTLLFIQGGPLSSSVIVSWGVKFERGFLIILLKKWRRGVVVITTAQIHLSKPELRFCAGSNPAHCVSEIRDDEDHWQWSWLEIRLRLSSINHTTQTIHHLHHHHHLHNHQGNSLMALLIWSVLAFLRCHTSRSEGGG